MKVSELIEKLKEMPQDYEVKISDTGVCAESPYYSLRETWIKQKPSFREVWIGQ